MSGIDQSVIYQVCNSNSEKYGAWPVFGVVLTTSTCDVTGANSNFIVVYMKNVV